MSCSSPVECNVCLLLKLPRFYLLIFSNAVFLSPPSSNVLGSDLPAVEAICRDIIKQKLPFQRVEVTWEDLLELFKVRGCKGGSHTTDFMIAGSSALYSHMLGCPKGHENCQLSKNLFLNNRISP